MTIETKFAIAQDVRVVRDGGFVGEIIGVHDRVTEETERSIGGIGKTG